ncbi:MAG: hypothetical protein WCT77_01650 [Bacteroidota bacterium]|jgi:hypothetical protein
MNKYEITYLIDVVSKNPEDYTLKCIVEAENEIDAIKKDAGITDLKEYVSEFFPLDCENCTVDELMKFLMNFGFCYTNIKKL